MLFLPVLFELDRGQVAKRTVEMVMIVFVSPVLEEDLSFEYSLEEVADQDLVAQSRVE